VAAEIRAKGVEFTGSDNDQAGVRICFIRGPQASRSNSGARQEVRLGNARQCGGIQGIACQLCRRLDGCHSSVMTAGFPGAPALGAVPRSTCRVDATHPLWHNSVPTPP